MNWLLTISGLFAAFTTIGHFAVGTKQYLVPTLEASFDEVPKKVMHCLFHYISVFLILSAAVLLAAGFGLGLGGDSTPLIRFIAISYAAFAGTQIVLAVRSDIERAPLKLFQWTFFVLIAVFAWLGTRGA
jgi:hypothetical protein